MTSTQWFIKSCLLKKYPNHISINMIPVYNICRKNWFLKKKKILNYFHSIFFVLTKIAEDNILKAFEKTKIKFQNNFWMHVFQTMRCFDFQKLYSFKMLFSYSIIIEKRLTIVNLFFFTKT